MLVCVQFKENNRRVEKEVNERVNEKEQREKGNVGVHLSFTATLRLLQSQVGPTAD